MATTGNQLLRAGASLANGICGTFGGYTLVSGGTDPVSPKSDAVSDQACYRYQYVVLDSRGNATPYTSLKIKVDLTPPAAPSLGFSGFTNTNTYWSGSGSTVFYRSLAPSGSFVATATAADAASGIASYAFPSLGTNWNSTPGALGVNTYSWSTGPQAPGPKTVTATNNATGVSGATPLTLTTDDTAPSAGSVTPPNASQAITSVSVGFTTGTDGGSGVGTRLLQRQSAPLTGTTTCGTYGAWTTVGTNPTSSPFSDNTVTAGSCYKYQYIVSDNVGNLAAPATSTNAVKVIAACGTQLLGNPGFENGATATPWTGTGDMMNSAARTGAWKARLGGNDGDVTETLSQDVTIPAYCAGDVSLSYWLQVTTSETSGPWDYFHVQVISGGTTATLQTYSDRYFGGAYIQRTVDLSAYKGLTTTLRFLSDEDGSVPTDFWLDDVSLITTADTTGPTGGSVGASGLVGTGARYAASTTLSLNLAKGTDPNLVAATGNLLKRATGTLGSSGGTADGTCSAFGSYTTVGTDPVSPMADTVTDQACYSYKYVVADTFGNSTTYTSPDIKVDLAPPSAPSLGFSGFANNNTFWTGSGSTVFYRSLAASGSFVATATATDAASGIAGYTFPPLGTNWTSTGAGAVRTYSWSVGPQAPGLRFVTATNNAGIPSATSSFMLTADDTAPTGSTVSPPSTTQTSTTVSVDYLTGTDGGSGVGTRLLQRRGAPLTGTTCGSYNGWTTAATNPSSSPFSDTVTRGYCYQYQYVVADNVGNTHTASSLTEVKVTASSAYFTAVSGTSGLLSYYRLGEASPASSIADSKGTNNGTYYNTPTMGVVGIAGDASTAATFNGTSQYGTVTRQIAGDFSIEFWFKSTQNYAGGDCSSWWQGAGLIDADLGGGGDDFGISLCSGRILAGVGAPDVSIVTPVTYRDGAWHHVVFTRTQTGGAMKLYVDGAAAGTATGSVNLLQAQLTINFARSARGDQYFAGTMDEIALYNTALPAATVTAHYNAR